MNKKVMEKIIKDTLSKDQKLLVDIISQRLGVIDQGELGMIFDNVIGFIALIPNLMEQIASSDFGRQFAISSSPLMQAIENYYIEKEDILPASKYPDARSLIDDTYYGLTLLLSVLENFPNQTLLNALDLNYAHWLFRNLLGAELAKKIENRVTSDVRKLTVEQQKMMKRKLDSLRLENVNKSMTDITPSSEYTPSNYSDNSNWYDYQASSYSAEDQFEADSAGWPGGAYDNPDSSWYSNDDDY